MAHYGSYGFFCTQYLLENNCKRRDSCIFRHEAISAENLDEPIPNGSDFVKGFLLNHNGKHTDQKARYFHSKLPCYYNTIGATCPYGNSCVYTHPLRKKRTTMEGPSVASTSSTNINLSASSSTQLDESYLGATALLKDVPNSASSSGLDDFDLGSLNIDAPEFIPKTMFNCTMNSKKRLCPFAERDGLCKYPPGECTYLHGDNCDLCTRPALHPFNEELRKKHTTECIKRHERDMEIAFSVARSKDKLCGICFEVIMQKSSNEQRFGILPSCNHCFCLACIRRWRQSKQFENKIIRSCPECRTPSDFVCPSAYWVDTKEDKDKVIEKYKGALAKKDCKYFKNGRGNCPFGNKCFYRHCLNNGKKIDVGPPPSTNNSNAETFLDHGVEIIQRLLMLEHLQDGCPLEDFPQDMDLEDIIHMLNLSDFLSDTEDTDYWSE